MKEITQKTTKFQAAFYSFQLEAAGNKPITWDKISGKLPSGITLSNSGLISGTASKSGAFKFKVKASNSYGNDEKEYTLTIYQPVEIATASFKDGITGKSYSATAKLKKSDKTVTWTAEGLPNGLTMNAKGKISGKPSVYGTFSVKITASNGAESVSKTIPLTIKAIAPKLSGSLAKAKLGELYSSKLKLTKGTAPVTWTLEGSLPDGLNFDESTGTLSDTPVELWNDSVIVTAENDGGSASKNVKIYVKGTKPSIKTAKLPNGKVGVYYTAELSAKGSPAITWSAEGLPEGLTLTGNKITGTPEESGKKISVTVTASNPAGKRSKTYRIKIDPTDKEDTKETQDDNTRLPVFGETPGDDYSIPAMSGGAGSEGANYDGYIVAAELGMISCDVPGMYDFEIELPDCKLEGLKLVYISNSDEPSSDDEIAEFFDEEGNEISKVPESRKIIVSVWLNPQRIYEPVIAVKR